MPSFFLTVRLPYMLLGPDGIDDPDRVLDPNLTHEKNPRVFYEVDSRVVGERLLDLFRYRKPTLGSPADPIAQVGSSEHVRDLIEGGSQPVFELVNAADLDWPQRVLWRDQIGALEKIEAVGDWDPGVWADGGLPHDRAAVLLIQYRYQAREWEPLVRDEMGVRGQVSAVFDPGPGDLARLGMPRDIAGLLNRGDFPKLAHDEYLKLGAWLNANRQKVYGGLDPLSLERTREVEDIKKRLLAIYEYNTTLRPARAAHRYAVLTALGVSVLLIAVFEGVVHWSPWTWVRNHPDSFGLQAGICGVIISFVLGLLRPPWRKVWWVTVLLAFVVVIVSLLGGPTTGVTTTRTVP